MNFQIKIISTLLVLFIFNSAVIISQPLTLITGKRIYEHHSSSINGNNYYGIYANGFQSGYDFLNNIYKNTTTSSDHADMDLVETNGIFGNGYNYKNVGFTSGVSVIWQGAIYGNGATKYCLAPTTFNFDIAAQVSDLKAIYNSVTASTTVDVPQKGRTYIALVPLANAVRYVAIKITNTLGLTDQQAQDMADKKNIYADVYFDFDYKYGTIPGPVTAFSANNTTICAGQQVSFTDESANTPTTWNWSFPGGSPSGSAVQNPVVTYAATGTYDVVLVSSNSGGSTTMTKSNLIVVNPLPAKPVITSTGNILTSSIASTYQWFLNGNIISGAVARSYTTTINGNYTVAITSPDGCTDTSLIYSLTTTGISQADRNNMSIAVFPNPNDGHFTLNFEVINKDNYTIMIRNILGQLVYTNTVANFSGTYSTQIDISSFGKSLYTLTVSDSKQESVKKLLVL
jgi:PKD repeat protein